MQIATITKNTTMSSREIAELVESRHDKVKQSIDRLANRGVLTLPPLVETSFTGVDGRKQTVSVYNLDKRSSLIVVAQLCPEFTARIVDRWQELEEKQSTALALPDFNNPAVAARAWAEQYEAKTLALEVVEKQKIQLESQAYSVAYVDNFVKAEGLIGIREAGKVFGINQNALVNMLIGANVLFRENGHLQAYAQDIAAGRFVAKVELDANGKARPSTKFTSKGLRWVAGKLKLDQLFND